MWRYTSGRWWFGTITCSYSTGSPMALAKDLWKPKCTRVLMLLSALVRDEMAWATIDRWGKDLVPGMFTPVMMGAEHSYRGCVSHLQHTALVCG